MNFKPLLSAALSLAIAATGYSQQIQDANLRIAIQTECPSCIDASYNLTPAAAQLTILRLGYYDIVEVSGLQGFSSLRTLQLMGNQIDSLADLPATLEELYVDDNPLRSLGNIQQLQQLRLLSANYCQLQQLPTLPDSIQRLSATNNRLDWAQNLPAGLVSLDLRDNLLYALPTMPAKICSLYLDYNQFSQLPSPLPDSLKYLYVNNNRLTSLPVDFKQGLENVYASNNVILYADSFPQSLRILDLSNNLLQTFPNLPDSILSVNVRNNQLDSLPDLSQFLNMRVLSCGMNYLYQLPALPAGLRTLQCDFNYLSALPMLPDSLINLDCEHNSLLSLPALGSELNLLNCSFNDLQQLPALPANLYYLSAGANPELDCLPLLPENLSILYVSATNVQCLPNIPNNGMFSHPLPLCDSLTNPNQCQILSSITAEAAQAGYFELYPNPNGGDFWVKLPNHTETATLQVYNQLGQEVASQLLYQNNQKIQIPKLNAGLYYAKVSNNGSSSVRQFRIQ